VRLRHEQVPASILEPRIRAAGRRREPRNLRRRTRNGAPAARFANNSTASRPFRVLPTISKREGFQFSGSALEHGLAWVARMSGWPFDSSISRSPRRYACSPVVAVSSSATLSPSWTRTQRGEAVAPPTPGAAGVAGERLSRDRAIGEATTDFQIHGSPDGTHRLEIADVHGSLGVTLDHG
jgi:hypothetical protein